MENQKRTPVQMSLTVELNSASTLLPLPSQVRSS